MDKRIVASFAPDSEFTRHSEGAFLRLRDGGIMFAYSRFSGSQRDDAPSDIAAVFSYDEGETWSEARVLVEASMYNTENVMSVSLMRMKNADVGLFYIVKQTPTVSRILLSRSNDDGKTFYSHTECTLPDREGYVVLNNDRVERLESGRLLMPLAYHRCGMAPDGKVFMDSRSFTVFMYSDDDGYTWHESPDVVYPPFTDTRTGLQEPGAIQLADGTIWGYSRTDKMYQYEYFSHDDGLHWTIAQPSRFTSPPSPMKIARDPYSGKLYSFWNPDPLYNGRQKSPSGWGRTPLVMAVSSDDGANWSEPHILEDEPEHGYCYPAVFFANDHSILLAYCAGGPEDGICLARLSIMKITI